MNNTTVYTDLNVGAPVGRGGGVRTSMLHQVMAWLQSDDVSPTPQVRTVVVNVPKMDALAWLNAQEGYPKGYWSGREGGEEVAYLGIADRCKGTAGLSYEAMEAGVSSLLASASEEVRYYGGLRFGTPSTGSDGWDAFGAFQFVLPRFELRSDAYSSTLRCNLVLPRDLEEAEEILASVRALRFQEERLSGALPGPVFRDDTPAFMGWSRNVKWALEAFASTRLGKLVLARKATLGFAAPLRPLLLMHRLKACTPSRFHFCLMPEEGVAFLGASPERLVRLEGREVWTEAVAGTRPRSVDEADDARLRQELLLSEKDQREHEYVRQSIKEVLSQLCVHHHIDVEASEMKLSQGRHLVSKSFGRLQDGDTIFDLLRHLHPTPAVGGYPHAEALKAIARLEPFDRGWYAGPIGWISRSAAEFAVAIRSGLVRYKQLALYSGAGIVRGSNAAAEWDEIEQKLADFVNILGLELQYAK